MLAPMRSAVVRSRSLTGPVSPPGPSLRFSRKYCWLKIQAISVPHLAPQFLYSDGLRSEEHTSELQSHSDLVCRLLLEKKKKHKCQSLRISSRTLSRHRQTRSAS